MSKSQGPEIPSSGGNPTFAPGTQILGRFQIVQRANNDQGTSFLCKRIIPPHQGDLVVLKLFGKARVTEDLDKAMLRFQHEIVAAFSVKHENVAGILETVRIGDTFGYLMEYADGDTLASIIENEGKVEVGKALHLVKQMCAGTQAIHAAGITHRGLKPANISVTKHGNVKIRDFGLAKLEGQKRLTQTGALVGTLAYVSPEYVLEGICDSRLDLYSIGVICYEMLCGVTPFESEDFVKMFTARVTQSIPRPEVLCPFCPRAFGDVIIKALQPNAKNRFQTAAEMSAALEAIVIETSDPFKAKYGSDSQLKQSRMTRVFKQSPLGPNATTPESRVVREEQPSALVELTQENIQSTRVPQGTRTLSGTLMDTIRRKFWGKKV